MKIDILFLNRMGDNRIEIYKIISNIVYKSIWGNYSAMHRLKLQIICQINKAFDAKYSSYHVLFNNSFTIKKVYICMLDLRAFNSSKVEKTVQ